jgi:hypothetical protein
MGEVLVSILIGGCMIIAGVIMRVTLTKEMKKNTDDLTE